MKPTLSIIDGTEADADLYIQIIIILCGFITLRVYIALILSVGGRW